MDTKEIKLWQLAIGRLVSRLRADIANDVMLSNPWTRAAYYGSAKSRI